MTTLQVDYGWVEQKVKELATQSEVLFDKLIMAWPDSDIVRAALAEAYQKGAESSETIAALLDYISTLQVREATLTEEIVHLKARLYGKGEEIVTLREAIKGLHLSLRTAADSITSTQEEIRQARLDLITKPED